MGYERRDGDYGESRSPVITTIHDLPRELVETTLRHLDGDVVAISAASMVCQGWWNLLHRLSGRLNMNPRERARLNRLIVLRAVEHGRPEVLQWLRDKGCCRYDSGLVEPGPIWPDGGRLSAEALSVGSGCLWCCDVRLMAARCGHVALLATEKYGPPCACVLEARGRYICDAAADGGSIAALEWAVAHGYGLTSRTVEVAARRGNVATLTWLLGSGCPVAQPSAFEAAAHSGSVATLDTLARSCEADTWYTYFLWEEAVKSGSVPVLEWLERHAARSGYQPASEVLTCAHAARWGNLDVLKWLRSRGCDWDDWESGSPYFWVADNGDLAMLKWCKENGCPRKGYNLLSGAFVLTARQAKRSPEMLSWCVNELGGVDDNHLSQLSHEAARCGRVDILVWLESIVGHGFDKETFNCAVGNGKLKAMAWLRGHGCPFDHREASLEAARGGRVQTLA